MSARTPRAIGTAAESAVVRAGRRLGFPEADRRALHGRDDVGDVLLCRDVVVEVKGGHAAASASDAQVELWLTDVERERRNAGAEVAFLVLQRPRVSAARAERWWAWWRLGWLPGVELVNGTAAGRLIPVRMTFENACGVLFLAGYGDDDRRRASG